jgi:hypothetical protein
MSKIILLILLTIAFTSFSGCKSQAGSREYIPGKGWKTNN